MESKDNQIIKPLTNENNFNIEDMLDSDFEAMFNSLETDYIIHSKEATKVNFQNEQTQLNDYYLVLSISVQNKNSKKIKCKKLSKKDLSSVPSLTLKSEIIEVLLTGIWADTTIYPNDKIFLSVNNFSQSDKCFLLTSSLSQIPNNSNHKNVIPYILSNYLIVEPETLLSPTQIKSGIRCYRNAFFQEEFKLCTYPDITRYTLQALPVAAIRLTSVSSSLLLTAPEVASSAYSSINITRAFISSKLIERRCIFSI